MDLTRRVKAAIPTPSATIYRSGSMLPTNPIRWEIFPYGSYIVIGAFFRFVEQRLALSNAANAGSKRLESFPTSARLPGIN